MDISKIITAEEILVNNQVFKEPEISNFNLIIHRDCYILAQENIKRAMIEFAKLHVEAFREECLINLKLGETEDDVTINLVEKRILNTYYPLNNIK